MSAYQGRTGPNFSQFLNDLNVVSPYEDNAFNPDLDDNDLAMFTNTDFTSLDMNLPDDSFDYNLNGENDMKYTDLLGADSQTFGAGPLNVSPADTPQFYGNFVAPIQPAPAAFPDNTSAEQSPANTQANQQRAKSASTHSPAVVSPEDNSRQAAEEDKRRRNTAASARFRVKKKQREAALERNMKDANDKNSKLQARIDQLEMENKWLKDLVTEKNGNAIQSKEEIDEAFQQFKRESEERQDVREEGPRVKGVGTQ